MAAFGGGDDGLGKGDGKAGGEEGKGFVFVFRCGAETRYILRTSQE